MAHPTEETPLPDEMYVDENGDEQYADHLYEDFEGYQDTGIPNNINKNTQNVDFTDANQETNF